MNVGSAVPEAAPAEGLSSSVASHPYVQPVSPVQPAEVNPIRTRADWEAAREAALRDPGRFHGAIATRELHWFDASLGRHGAWITRDADGRWTGLDARTAAPIEVPHGPEHAPWTTAFDAADAPFYRWFVGGRTNAAFNAVDRHVALGHGHEPAFLFEGDRWDQSLHDGRGGPVRAEAISRKRLCLSP